MDKVYRYEQNFQVRYSDVDFKDELSLTTALSYMQEVASWSAEELGFGYSYLKPRDIAFVVSNNRIRFLKPIPLSSFVCLQTWPLPPSFATFGREYRFSSNDGETVALATSRWCLMDMTTGKILPSKTIEGQDYSTYNTERVLPDTVWKIPVFDCNEGALGFTVTVANSEYDHYFHVNNARYAAYCLNVFTVKELSSLRLESFSIAYAKQCFEGETLRFYKKKREDGSYLVHGFNEKGEAVVLSEIRFAEGVE